MTAAAHSAGPFPRAGGEGSGKSRRALWFILALACSFALHLALYFYLVGSAVAPPPKVEEVTIDVREVEKPKPPPPQVKPPEPLKAQKQPRLVAKAQPKEKPPPQAPPPPNQPPPPEPPKAPPPIRIGVNLDSTVAAGGFAAPVGNTMYGQAPSRAPAPATASKPYWAAKYVAPSQVSEIPVLLEDVKVPYPAEARKDGIEGQVVMLMTIDDQGKVVEVKRVSGPGHGLDEAAVEAAKRFRFKPAKYNGAAVATQIRYTYSFEID